MFNIILPRLYSLFSKNNKHSIFTKDLLSNELYKIGDYTYGSPEVLFSNKDSLLVIGKFCSIAQNVTIFLGGNHRTDWISTYPFNEIFIENQELKKIEGHPSTKGSVIINNDVWIGRNVIILSGIEIADGAVVAAGSVVTKNIGPYEIWGGNPAKFIRKRFDDNVIENLVKTAWWNWEINEIVENAKMLCSSNVEEFINKMKRE